MRMQVRRLVVVGRIRILMEYGMEDVVVKRISSQQVTGRLHSAAPARHTSLSLQYHQQIASIWYLKL